MLPSLYSPKNRTVESTVGGGGGLPGAGMRLEAVRAVDGLADGRGMEEAVPRGVGLADSRGTPVADGQGGRPGDGGGRLLCDQPGRQPGDACSGRRGWTVGADGRADDSSDGQGGRPGDRRAVVKADARRDGRLCPACGRVGGRPPGKHSCPPGFYPRVNPDFRGRPTSRTSDVLTTLHFARKVSELRLLLLPLFHSLSAKHKRKCNTMKAESKCGSRGQKGWLICLSDPSVLGMFLSMPTVATFPIRSQAKFLEPLLSNRNQSVRSGFPLGSFRSTALWARKPDLVLTHLSMLSSSHLF